MLVSKLRLALVLAACALLAGTPAQGQPGAKPAAAKPDAKAAKPAEAAKFVPGLALALEKTKLANGLEVILHEDKRAPIVTVNIWYHVGGKDEEPGKSGFAHLFEHVMFQGSKHVPEDTYFRYLEAAGGTGINGSTSTDRTNYFETVPKNRLELALWLESDRMGFLLHHVDQKTFASQRDVVKNERRQRMENSPYGWTIKYISEAVFPEKHPYRILPIGSPEHLDAASLEDVKNFFRTWYVPNNATLVIAGDFDKTKTLNMVEKYFGPIPAGKLPERPPAPPVKLEKETRLEIVAGVELPKVTMAWAAPPQYAAGDAEMSLIGQVLTNGKSSRLYKKLVHDLRIATAVSAGPYSRPLGSMFLLEATAAPGHTNDELIKAIDEELAILRKDQVKDAELARAKTGRSAAFTFALDSLSTRAELINGYNQDAGDPNFLARDMARTERVTLEGLREAVREYLPADKRVIAVVTPVKGAPISGELKATK